MSKNPSKQSNLTVVPSPTKEVTGRSRADDSSVCPKCLGSGMEIVPGKGARQCACQKRSRQTSPFERMRIPQRYVRCHLNSYNPVGNSQQDALRVAKTFIFEFPAYESGLLLMGPIGVGKTHLAVSILMGLDEQKKGFNYLFCEYGSLLKQIQESYNPNTQASELAVLAPVLNADVLVLDELGSSKPTAWVKDTIAHIINTRYNNKKHTIFTTNYRDTRKDEKSEILEDRIGVSMRSRLYEMCRTVEIEGSDYRKAFFGGKGTR